MSQKIDIAVDLMGTDHGPQSVAIACQKTLQKYNDLTLTLIGTKEILDQINLPNVKKIVSSTFINQNDSPLVLRKKTDSSMEKGMQLLNHRKVDAFVVGGNSGALVTLAYLKLGTLPNIKKVGFMAFFPRFISETPLGLLDVGANLAVDGDDLAGFAKMAKIFYQNIWNIARPKVAILNIGTEKEKGLPFHQEAYQLLVNDQKINFNGFIEPKELFNSPTDIVVTDGYGGNIVLKTLQGLLSHLVQTLKKSYRKPSGWLGYLFSKRIFNKIKSKLSYEKHAAAIVLGVNGLVVKTHGSAKTAEFISAIELAYFGSKKSVMNKITHALN